MLYECVFANPKTVQVAQQGDDDEAPMKGE